MPNCYDLVESVQKQIIQKYWFPDPQGFHRQMMKTLNSMIKVTKKIMQRNFLEKLIKLKLLSQNAEHLVNHLIRANKSKCKSSLRNRMVAGNIIMNLQLRDACIDLEETDEEAGVNITETLAYCKTNNPQCYTDFKKDFFKVASQFREREWKCIKVKQSKSITFKKQKSKEQLVKPILEPGNQINQLKQTLKSTRNTKYHISYFQGLKFNKDSCSRT